VLCVRNKIVGSTTMKPQSRLLTLKENGTLEVSGSFTAAKRALGSHWIRGLLGPGVGVDALEESVSYP
jgi:hypothetical protein